MQSLVGNVLVKSILDPVSVTSDGATGNYVDYNGYNRALIICMGGLVGTGDSDDTVAFQVHRIDDVAAASADSDDHVDITAATQTLGPPADTDVEIDIELIDIDFPAHSLDNGCLNITATGSEGCAAVCSALIVLYQPTGTHTDTGMTVTQAASS